ncbi:amino acid ABC transporter substrate-binding protein [Candidatus Pacearchaeota archaeon]|nr:amino acid ABC transporter substrate-binding protein [Candidatus Pacearchaeota archaeon]
MKKSILIIVGGIIMIAIIAILILIAPKETIPEDDSFVKIKDKEIIKIGTGGEAPPHSYYNEDDELTGYDIELIKEIMKRLDIGIEFIIIPWTEIFNDMKAGKVDVIIDGITITPERSQEMLFSDSYFLTGQALIVKKENTDIISAEDLDDKKVGTQIGTTSAKEAMKYASNIKFITYEGTLTAIEDLRKNTIDAAITDFGVANKIIKENDDLKIIGDLLSKEHYGIVTQKNNIALIDEINEVLQEIKDDGTLDKLETKWFSQI